MKPEIHPQYQQVDVHCACGEQFMDIRLPADVHVTPLVRIHVAHYEVFTSAMKWP